MKKKKGQHRLPLGFLFLFVSLFCTAEIYAQPLVNMNYRDASFVEVIGNFKKQTGVKFLYNLEKVKDRRCMELELRDMPVDDAIQVVLRAFNLNYSMVEGVVVVDDTQNNVVAEKEKTQVITGRVMSESGEPLPGVTVLVKGSTMGVSSDIHGYFKLLVHGDETKTLVFSFVGMLKKEVKCTDSKPLAVVLEQDNKRLNEVVVTGYQSIDRRDMVGAHTTVKAKDIMMPAYTSIDQMLQGKVAGLVVMNNSSRVGRTPKITIRGTSTILGNTDPLWVVDGVIQSDPLPFDQSSTMTSDLRELIGNQVSWLNPADIETITVLKDASATAIYGSKASNGVIVITTQRGRSGRTSIRYSGNFSFRARPNYDMFDFMNSKERIQFSKEAYDAGARYQKDPLPQTSTYEGLMHMLNSRLITEEAFIKQMEKLETVNTDWFDILTRNSFSQNHNLSISGGSDKMTYTSSLGYSKNSGIEIGNDMNQLTVNLSLNAYLMKNLRMNFSLMTSHSENKGYGPDVNPLSYATNMSRAIPAFEDNGDLLYYKQYESYTLDSKQRMLGYNILNELANTSSQNKASIVNATVNLDWQATSWLTYQLVAGLASNNNRSESYAGEKSYYIAKNYRGYDYNSVTLESAEYKAAMLPFGGELLNSAGNSMSYNMQHKLLFSKNFSDDQRLNVMIAGEVRSVKNENRSNTAWGYVPERGEKLMKPTPFLYLEPMGTSKPENTWGVLDALYNGKWQNTTRTDNFVSFFATLAYSLKNRYVFNANVRSDASNRFGQDANKQFDPTYSFGVSWNVAQENFVKDNISWLEQLNFRATWGIQGNVVNSVSPDLILSQGGVLEVYNQYYVTINSLPNPFLKWERTKTWNLGLDLQLLKGITMSLDYYGRASNAIVNQDIPYEYGRSSMQLNGGHIGNHGIEFSMNLTPFQRDNIAWTVGFNASKNWNKSKVADRDIQEGKVDKDNFLSNSGNSLLKKGYPLSAFWSYSFAGLSSEGYPTFNYLDVKEEQRSRVIDPTTFLVYSGQSDPYFTGGLNTRFRYKSLSLGADFALLLGATKRLPDPYQSFAYGKIPEPNSNLPRKLNNRWKNPGDGETTDIPALFTSMEDINLMLPDGLTSSMYSMWAKSDNMTVNASFLRCTQLTLTWNMNPNLCAKFGATSLAVTANVNNLFVIGSEKFDGFDPELDRSVMPKIFSFGFNVGF